MLSSLANGSSSSSASIQQSRRSSVVQSPAAPNPNTLLGQISGGEKISVTSGGTVDRQQTVSPPPPLSSGRESATKIPSRFLRRMEHHTTGGASSSSGLVIQFCWLCIMKDNCKKVWFLLHTNKQSRFVVSWSLWCPGNQCIRAA